jgi:predicted dehydrogenase
MIETARRLLASGRMGAVGQVQIDFRLHYDFRGDFRETMDHPLILEMAVHHFDLIRWITGLEPVSVAAHTWNPPWSQFTGDASAACVFTMHGGARVLYSGTWHPRGQLTDWNGVWRIECERGYLVVGRDIVRVYEGDDPHRAGSADDETLEPLVALPYTDQAAVLMDVAEAVRAGRPAPTTARDNLRSIAMVFGALQAAASGEPVPLGGARDLPAPTG